MTVSGFGAGGVPGGASWAGSTSSSGVGFSMQDLLNAPLLGTGSPSKVTLDGAASRLPAPGTWGLILTDGDRVQARLDVRGLVWGFGASAGQAASVVIGADVAGIPDEAAEERVTLDFTAAGGLREVAAAIAKVNRAPVEEAMLRKAIGNVAALPPDRLDEISKGRTVGQWQIVVGADVRAVRYGACPPTHLPAVACQTQAEAERLIERTTAIGYDGRSRVAPEVAFGITLPALDAYAHRLIAIRSGALDESALPTPAEMLGRVRSRLAEATSQTGEVFSQLSLEPPPAAGSDPVERRIAESAGGFRVVSVEDFVMWAADRGLVRPAPLDVARFPGCERALVYPQGWYAIWYRDHVQLGRVPAPPAEAPAPRPQAAPPPPAPPAVRWHPVEAGLPPDEVWVVVKGDAGMTDGRPFIATARRYESYRPGQWLDASNEPLASNGWTPTHWAPLADVLGESAPRRSPM